MWRNRVCNKWRKKNSFKAKQTPVTTTICISVGYVVRRITVWLLSDKQIRWNKVVVYPLNARISFCCEILSFAVVRLRYNKCWCSYLSANAILTILISMITKIIVIEVINMMIKHKQKDHINFSIKYKQTSLYQYLHSCHCQYFALSLYRIRDTGFCKYWD